MKFCFEDLAHVNFTEEQRGYGEQPRNFIASRDRTDHRDLNNGMSRYDVSPVVQSILHHAKYGDRFENTYVLDAERVDLSYEGKYVISVGVNHSPDDWTGPPISDSKYKIRRRSLFDDLIPKYLKDLQQQNALLLIDQTHEGYTNHFLWKWFHHELKRYAIPASRIIYTSGDLNGTASYEKFCNESNISERMFVQPYAGFEKMIYSIVRASHWYEHSFVFDKNMDLEEYWNFKTKFKRENLEKIKTYDCLQKRSRGHRCWFYKYLLDAKLVKHGIVSTNRPPNHHAFHYENRYISEEEFDRVQKNLPMIHGFDHHKTNDEYISSNGGEFITKINEELMLHSFVSVTSEAGFSDLLGQGQCFLSEKTFKPISQCQPFIILGDKGSLEHMRQMGYKTFDGFIDESYDNLPTWERMEAITNEIKKITQMTQQEKLDWYVSMKDILIHNVSVMIDNCDNKMPKPAANMVEYIRKKL